MDSPHELVRHFAVESKSGAGLCPICHKPRSDAGCRTWWNMELDDARRWKGTLFVVCNTFDNADDLAVALNRYHQREPEGP